MGVTTENISRSIFTKCCQTQVGINPQPPDHQSGPHLTEPSRLGVWTKGLFSIIKQLIVRDLSIKLLLTFHLCHVHNNFLVQKNSKNTFLIIALIIKLSSYLKITVCIIMTYKVQMFVFTEFLFLSNKDKYMYMYF